MPVATRRSNGPSIQDVISYHTSQDVLRESNSKTGVGNGSDNIEPSRCELQGLNISQNASYLLELLPIVHVAWADGFIRKDQAQSILQVAAAHGIRRGRISYKLLEQWLQSRPDEILFQVWADYVGALHRVMSESAYADLRQQAVETAQSTARTLGPCFGLVPPTGRHTTAIQQIESAFDGE